MTPHTWLISQNSNYIPPINHRCSEVIRISTIGIILIFFFHLKDTGVHRWTCNQVYIVPQCIMITPHVMCVHEKLWTNHCLKRKSLPSTETWVTCSSEILFLWKRKDVCLAEGSWHMRGCNVMTMGWRINLENNE